MNTLSLRRGPFRLALSSGPWASAWYLFGYQFVGRLLFALPKALLAAAVFLVLFLLFNYVLVATARAHAAVVRALLGSTEDPLREAKEVLRSPGPLRTFIPNGHG